MYEEYGVVVQRLLLCRRRITRYERAAHEHIGVRPLL